MRLSLPSGHTATIEDPVKDFPAAIEAAEVREEKAREDIRLLKRLGKQSAAWPVATEAEGGAK